MPVEWRKSNLKFLPTAQKYLEKLEVEKRKEISRSDWDESDRVPDRTVSIDLSFYPAKVQFFAVVLTISFTQIFQAESGSIACTRKITRYAPKYVT